MQQPALLPSDDAAVRNALPGGASPGDDDKIRSLLGRWLDLSELERRAFGALTRELTMSSHLVETSTVELSERFQKLADLAQHQVTRVDTIATVAKTIEVNGAPFQLDEALHAVGDVLLKVIDTILSISKHAMRMVYALDDVVRDVQGAEHCVTQIDAINTQTRYLALNAAIEANRSGEAGAAFRVIAHEIKDLSRATEETSRQVRDRIASITSGVRNGHKVLQEIATIDMSEHILAKEQLDGLLAGIIAQNEAFSAVLSDTSASSADMQQTIGQLITGMQFQDRTKQHIAQVIEVLGVLEEATLSVQQESWAACPGLFQSGSIDQAWLARIVEKRSLSTVKQRLLTRLLTGEDGADAPTAAGAPEHDIELF